ncbi:lytic transglycosylase domain-containing protein [Cognatilysobacter tabacisoli]|uniref:lytic transglycosylase domain-containing protein n=1 Tax=Cognatilysobacter tabacisoli TaxID=2315424 RepID=UPI000E6B411F|nr:lytic transglycosylase domain-containing protein [Lysobacter tabacisoli]
MNLTLPALLSACVAVVALVAPGAAHARTVYRCVQGGVVSLATAPEPGSRCVAREVDDNAVQVNLWGAMGVVSGTLYERQQDGRTVYSTRKLPGSTRVLSFTVKTPPGEPAHAGLGRVGAPRLEPHDAQFRSAAKRAGVDEAWLRAIAHAESGFDARAVSNKGAQGVMQLMPATAREYGVRDPFSPEQSIDAGARHLRALLKRYRNDRVLAAAAYNAGIGAVARHGGVPPYTETRDYIAKVAALESAYAAALQKARPKRRAAAVGAAPPALRATVGAAGGALAAPR